MTTTADVKTVILKKLMDHLSGQRDSEGFVCTNAYLESQDPETRFCTVHAFNAIMGREVIGCKDMFKYAQKVANDPVRGKVYKDAYDPVNGFFSSDLINEYLKDHNVPYVLATKGQIPEGLSKERVLSQLDNMLLKNKIYRAMLLRLTPVPHAMALLYNHVRNQWCLVDSLLPLPIPLDMNSDVEWETMVHGIVRGLVPFVPVVEYGGVIDDDDD